MIYNLYCKKVYYKSCLQIMNWQTTKLFLFFGNVDLFATSIVETQQILCEKMSHDPVCTHVGHSHKYFKIAYSYAVA